MQDNWVVVGKLLGAFGIKGWIKLYSHTRPMENIKQYNPLWLKKAGEWQQIHIEGVQRHGKGLVAKLKGCDTPEQVPAFSGCELAVKRGQLPELAKDDFYWSDLIDLRVYTREGVCLGRIDSVFETGANDVLSVVSTESSLDDRDRLVPYLWQDVVLNVDLSAGSMVVDWDADF